MAHTVVTASLEDVDEAVDVAPDVGVGVGDGVAHSSLGREVYHGVETAVGEQHPHGVGVLEVHADEAVALAVDRRGGEPVPALGLTLRYPGHGQTRELERGVVV